jgi:hypothetical protein
MCPAFIVIIIVYQQINFIFNYLEELLNNNPSNRWQWPILTANSQSSLSPPIQTQMISKSLPPSPIDATFANSPDYIASTTGLNKNVSVR